MKQLIVVRHAKSSWKQPQLSDHDRPLNKRGTGSIELIRHWLSDQQIRVDQLYSSSACRALTTAQRLNPSLTHNTEVIETTELYSFDWRSLWQFVSALDQRLDSVALVGHNPAMLELCNELIEEPLDRFDRLPTCSLVQLELSIAHWSQLQPACGQLLCSVFPKQLQPHS